MNTSSFIITPIYLLILSSLLLFQSPRPVQSISLSRLCGRFGHACFGGNWGKRASQNELSPKDLSSDVDTNNVETAMSFGAHDNSIKNDALDELRLKVFRQRLRQLLELE